MGESLLRSPVQTERREVCTSDRGQDSPIQTDLAQKWRRDVLLLFFVDLINFLSGIN